MLAAREGSGRSREALEDLCRTYRSPVVAFIRSRGHGADDTEDLAQAFFAYLLEQALHAHADPARGRFRSFLLTALKNFLGNHDERTRARKRGGEIVFQSLASLEGGHEPAEMHDHATPDEAFERDWAEAALRAAMRKLQSEANAAGKGGLFEALCTFLIERPEDAEYDRIAQTFHIRRNTIAVAVHRLRRRLTELVREELADTAVDAGHLEREMGELRPSLAAIMG